MSYSNKLSAFKSGTGSLAFACIEARNEFAKDLEDRHEAPKLIDQLRAPLCGPAAFMYCIARENPDAYGEYVLDLAMTGEGRIGNLVVKPGTDCRKAGPDAKNIAPVDWVALASLRDTSNSFWDVEGTGSSMAGITTGSDLASWFQQTGWFTSGVIDTANKLCNQSLDNLLEVNKRSTNSYVCLLVRAAILTGGGDLGIHKIGKQNAPKTFWGGANHWVVLGDDVPAFGTGCNKNIMISVPGKPPYRYSPPGSDALLQGRLDFSVYSWGGKKAIKKINQCFNDLTVEQFLRYYYGFVIASK